MEWHEITFMHQRKLDYVTVYLSFARGFHFFPYRTTTNSKAFLQKEAISSFRDKKWICISRKISRRNTNRKHQLMLEKFLLDDKFILNLAENDKKEINRNDLNSDLNTKFAMWTLHRKHKNLELGSICGINMNGLNIVILIQTSHIEKASLKSIFWKKKL